MGLGFLRNRAEVSIPLGGRVAACFLVLFWFGFTACANPLRSAPRERPASATPKWYAQNGPLLAEYLETLPPEQIGQPLKGIRLSGEADGLRWLEGQTYLGIPSGLPSGVSVRLVTDGARTFAYIWVNDEAAEFTLEPCADGEQKGIRARQAGGAPYAWTVISPAHGVVYTACPPESWLPDAPLPSDPSSSASIKS
ncbi:MAG: hypothetical protein P8Q97_00430 [Myxococcota bacterium]|jgi:hypothetical protein|nr:hypothetical protein [Myxococcota bacterium]